MFFKFHEMIRDRAEIRIDKGTRKANQINRDVHQNNHNQKNNCFQ